MTGLPEQFVDTVREDRFCNACGENLRGSNIERDPHYGMLLVRCPRCGSPKQVERRPLARTGQRWAGLVLAMWFLALLGLWAGTNMALIGVSAGVVEESRWTCYKFIEQAYENDFPEDAGGRYKNSVQFVPTNPPGPGSPVTGTITLPIPPVPPTAWGGSTSIPPPQQIQVTLPSPTGQPGSVTTTTIQNPSVQIFPAGPGRQVVITQQDDDLRNRFSRWWAQQDPKAMLEQIGGYGAAISWSELWPWALLGFVPLGFGFIWSFVLLNLSRRRLSIAFPVVIIWSLLTMLVMLLVLPSIPVNSPHDAAMLMIMPMLLPVLAVYFGGLLLIGLLVGRTLARGFVRLALTPTACSRFAQLWLADGKAPPRVTPLPA